MIFNAANRRGTSNLAASTALMSVSAAALSSWPPGDLIAGWVEDGTNITFPIASLSDVGVTAENADATTGDARALVLAFSERFTAWYNAADNKPGALSATIRSRRLISRGTWEGKDKQVFEVIAYKTYPDDGIAEEVT